MTWEETFETLSADWRAAGPDPLRMRQLLERIGHPEEKLHFIHIAGTNGKGSASAMLASILTRSGYRTGRYISPHLSSINERWSIDGEDISDEDLTKLLEELRPAIVSMKDTPTKFEILTALGFLFFCQKNCRVVVLEVGLGGRLDATNVIPVPDCALIMNIGLEHTEILGDTLREIAFEKGGIIKPGGDVVLYRQKKEVEAVIEDLCLEKGARLRVTSPECCTEPEITTDGRQSFDYRGRRGLRLSLLGKYQERNACAVLDAVDVLLEKGYHITEAAVREGLENTRWPGRFEVLGTDPLFIVDGAHNPNGVEALMESVETYLASCDVIFLMGVMADKDYDEMIRLAAPHAAHFIAEVPGGERDRALEEKTLAERIRSHYAGTVETADTVGKGVALALGAAERLSEEQGSEQSAACGFFQRKDKRKAAVVCFGSLYQVSEILEALRSTKSGHKGGAGAE